MGSCIRKRKTTFPLFFLETLCSITFIDEAIKSGVAEREAVKSIITLIAEINRTMRKLKPFLIFIRRVPRILRTDKARKTNNNIIKK